MPNETSLKHFNWAFDLDYTLQAYYSLTGEVPWYDFTLVGREWKRSTTFEGGPWSGTMELYALPIDHLDTIFYSFIGFRLEETSRGDLTWDGIIWEMDYTVPDFHTGVREPVYRKMRVSLENMYNAVKASYVDASDGSTGYTDWYTDGRSIAKYGRKEILIDTYYGADNADDVAQEFLQLSAHPRYEIIGYQEGGSRKLDITAVGVAATGQYKHVSVTGSRKTKYNVSTWLGEIIDTDLQWLDKGIIASNTRQVTKTLQAPTKAWNVLEDLASLRNTTGDRYRLQVDPGRVLHYVQWSNRPVGYVENGRFKSLTYEDWAADPRKMPTGIYRDLNLFNSGVLVDQAADPFYESVADFLVETIEVDRQGNITPKIGAHPSEEALNTFQFLTEKEEEKLRERQAKERERKRKLEEEARKQAEKEAEKNG